MGERTFWSGEVDDITIRFEHVDLLDGLDGLNVEFLERGLQFFVVGARSLVDFLLLPSRGAFAAVEGTVSMGLDSSYIGCWDFHVLRGSRIL